MCLSGHQVQFHGVTALFSASDRWWIEDGRRNYGHVVPLLRGQDAFWHSTSVDNLRKILDSGYLFSNDGQFKSPWGDYFGKQQGSICLFDFDTASEDEILYQAQNWARFLTDGLSSTVWIQISRSQLKKAQVKTYFDVVAEGFPAGCSRKYIPYVEAWHRGPIPVDTFTGYLLFGKPCAKIDCQSVPIGPGALEAIEAVAEEWARRREECRAAHPISVPHDPDLKEKMRRAQQRAGMDPRGPLSHKPDDD